MNEQEKNTLPPFVEGTSESKESFFLEIAKFALIALVIVVPVRLFIAQPFVVSGASMSPDFETSQYLIVDQLTYHLEEPERGDVIIFRFPLEPSTFFIKRIIGLPGETVTIHEGVVTITTPEDEKNILLKEPYIAPDNIKRDNGVFTLHTDEYFVMGDNRKASSDSRSWGVLPRHFIVGRAFVRLFPLSEVSLLPGQHN
jgi:signal peptidase I